MTDWKDEGNPFADSYFQLKNIQIELITKERLPILSNIRYCQEADFCCHC